MNRRSRRIVAQAERRGLRKCDVPFCESYCQAQLSNCPHAMCEQCVFNSIGAADYDEHQPHFGFKCAICRFRYSVSLRRMKTCMAKFDNTTHSKELPCCCPADCGKTYRVTHLACSAGCYDCEESGLLVELVSIHNTLVESDADTDAEEGEEESQEEDERSEEAGSEEHAEVTAMPNQSLDEMD